MEMPRKKFKSYMIPNQKTCKIFEKILTESKDAKASSKAISLLKEIQFFPFILSTII